MAQPLCNSDFIGHVCFLRGREGKVISTPQVEGVDLFDIRTISRFMISAPSIEI